MRELVCLSLAIEKQYRSMGGIPREGMTLQAQICIDVPSIGLLTAAIR